MGCAQSVPVAEPPVSASTKASSKAAVSGNKLSSSGSLESAGSPNYAAHYKDKTSTEESDEGHRPRFASYASGASTPDDRSEDGSEGSSESSGRRRSQRNSKNPKTLVHSTSAIGLDEMIEDRREIGDLRQNVVHIEVPFGKPIEEVYDGVHNGPVLGSGISGLVRLVTHKATGIKYAVKVLDLGLVDTSEGLRQLREEIFIMCQLDHPNIVRLEEVYESHSEIYLVQELCLGGELFDRLDEQPDYHYTEAECARLVKQMLSAVRYLHSRGIIHRDLKLENFLFSSTSKDSELKMIDFGLSKHFRYGEVQHEAVGTPYTVAPEVIRGTYDERCDIWAIGVISFLLLSGEPPFGGCGGPEPLMTVRSNILQGHFAFEPEDIWMNVSSLAREFIKTLLVTDPQKRPLAREAQKHKWMQEWASRSRKGNDNVLNPNVVKALVNFKEFSDMRKLLCEVLSFTLLPDQIKELRREFEKIDTDGSGEISLAALKQVLMTNAGAGSLGALTEEEVEDIFNAMRVRKTETRIHWHEFIAAGLSQCQVDDRNLRLAFDRLDSDHKGYITLDDIMDLMGSDGLQSEEAMRRMWGDSIRAVQCQHARITYGDFLLLMKGQSREDKHEVQVEMKSPGGILRPVPEVPSEVELIGEENGDKPFSLEPQLAEMPAILPTLSDGSTHTPPFAMKPTSPLATMGMFNAGLGDSQSAPTTPADHRRLIELEGLESPPSMDDDDGLVSSGPGVPGTSASLTPPQTPERGARDYVTPLHMDRFTIALPMNAENIMVPGLPSRPEPYARRRSRSVGDECSPEEKDAHDMHIVADAVRDMIVAESGHFHPGNVDSVVKDETKSALVVNRRLYRAHRQMRLAVLEASKRFEEQQARHARELILAAREAEGELDANMGMIQAGLVMRHGHKKQVSSEAIRKVLEDNRLQQLAMVEKANKRGGRGRRSRKKTMSDMAGMLSSMGADEMGDIANKAAAADAVAEPPVLPESKAMEVPLMPMELGLPLRLRPSTPTELAAEVAAKPLDVRGATVPGEFRKTSDPFSKQGKYGAVSNWSS